MKGRNPTPLEKKHMAKVAAIGCIVCRHYMGVFSPASVHHIEGKTSPGAHYNVIPLCPEHHQHGEHGPARHKNKAEFVEAFGEEYFLKKLVKDILNNT